MTYLWSEIHVSLQAESVEERSKALNEAFTYALFINVCRSLFEAHKLMFSFLLAVKILQNRKEIDPGMLLPSNYHFLHFTNKLCPMSSGYVRILKHAKNCVVVML